MIDLPDWPGPAAATPFFIDPGGISRGGLGAPDQRVNRLGGKYGLTVVMPPMPSGKLGRQWVAALIRAQTEGARMEFPQPSFDAGGPGDAKVSGSGQSGSVLSIKEAEVGYAFRAGQFFSVLTGGVHHIYMIAIENYTGGDGTAGLTIVPPIRVQHLDNDPLHFKPMIEGFVSGDERQWNLAVEHVTSIEFEIRERK